MARTRLTQWLAIAVVATAVVVATAGRAPAAQPTFDEKFLAAGGLTGTALTVSLTSPANNAQFSAPSSIAFAATASASSGRTIRKIQFFWGTNLIGVDFTAPYTFTWDGVNPGTYTVTAKATDSAGRATTSAAVTFKVFAKPTIAITDPPDFLEIAAPAQIDFTANARAASGRTLTKVEFFKGATLLGTDTTAPYALVWNESATGFYELTAKATDDLGGSTTSTIVHVTLTDPPTGNNRLLFGNNSLITSGASNEPGQAQTWRFACGLTAPLAKMTMYIGGRNTATTIKLGVYADNNSQPGALLTTATISNPTPDTWATANVNTVVNVTSGQRYWIALLAPEGGGTAWFKQDSNPSGSSKKSASTTLTNLPGTWVTGSDAGGQVVSIYATTN